MTSDWNPSGASTWCRLSGDLPQINGNVVVVVDDSSDKVSAFFEAEIPSLPENLEARLLKLPAKPKPDELISILGNTLASLFPEIGPEFSNLGPAKWIDAIRQQRESGETDDRWLLIDHFHHVLRAPALERKIFASVIQQLSDVPSFGVITGITTDSAIETAALLNLMDQKRPAGSKKARESNTTPIPLIEAGVKPKSDDPEKLAMAGIENPKQAKNWGKAAAAILFLSILGAGGYAYHTREKSQNPENSPVIAFGVRPSSDGVSTTSTLADTGKVESAPLDTAVIAPLEPAGLSQSLDEIKPLPFQPVAETKNADDFNTKHVEKNWKFNPGENAPEFEVQYFMGEAYCFGHGVEKDLEKGISMLKEASRDGSEKAANLLATCYSRGYGVEKNYEEAHRLLNLAIERGSPFAYGNLGVLYLRGFGCERDPARAQALFLTGADKGDPVAAYFAARCFEKGIGQKGGEPDRNRAVFWYLEAARWGHTEAIHWCREHELLLPGEKTIRF